VNVAGRAAGRTTGRAAGRNIGQAVGRTAGRAPTPTTRTITRPRAPLVLSAVVSWVAALVLVTVPASAGWAALAAAIALLVTLFALRRRPSFILAIVAISLVLSGCVAAQIAVAAGDRASVASFVGAGGRAIEVDAVVSTKVEPATAGSARFEVDARVVRVGGRELEASVPLAIWVDARVLSGMEGRDGLDLGSRVTVRGSARGTDPGDRAVLIVFATGVRVDAPPSGVLGVTAHLRQRFVEQASGLPGAGAGLVPGLAVGDTSGVSDELSAQMRTSSLSHLTAVSGANCAVVVALVFALAGLLRLPRIVRVILSLTALGCFVLLVTPEPSVLRAAAMTSIALLALAADRVGSGLAVLGLAVGVLLVSDPWLSHSLGFALSAAATAGLLVLSRPLGAAFARVLPTPLAVALSVPVAAQLACGPLLVLIDPRIPAYGVVANLLAGPAAPVATLVGLAACLLAVVPPLADVLTWIAWLPASWIAGVASVLSGLPGADLPWPGGVVGAVALAVASAALVFALVVRPRGAVARRARAGIALVVVAASGVAAGGVLLDRPLAPLTVPSAWSIAQCDIGQGDAVLLRSGDAVALIDTGPEVGPLEDCLARVGIARIDLLVLTHFDLDHVGAVQAVRGRVGTVIHGPTGEAADERMIRDLVRAGARAVQGTAGMSGSLGSARWKILWPNAGRSPFEPGNDLSIVLDVAGSDDGMPRGLYLGDLSAVAQRALRATGRVHGAFDVVKVAHHGSADQDPEFYRLVDAPLALIGVGADNDYGHPRAEILDVLTSLGATIVRTDIDGLGLVRRTGEGLEVWREGAR
jgi:competence protein ComEC